MPLLLDGAAERERLVEVLVLDVTVVVDLVAVMAPSVTRVVVVAGRAAAVVVAGCVRGCCVVLELLLLLLLPVPVMAPTVEATWPMVYCALLMSYMALLMLDNVLPQAVRVVAVMKVRNVFFILFLVLLVNDCYTMLSPSMY
jgi:hypothetical protein